MVEFSTGHGGRVTRDAHVMREGGAASVGYNTCLS